MNKRLTEVLIGAALIVAILSVYWPVYSFDFTNYDDLGYVTENYMVQGGLTRDGFQWALSARDESNWHPLTWMSHMIDCDLYGPWHGKPNPETRAYEYWHTFFRAALYVPNLIRVSLDYPELPTTPTVAGCHHITSLFFHIGGSLLLFIALRWMTRTMWPSALVAALFAVHPLHVESVAWVAERKDVLSTFFEMAALVAYVSYVRSVARGAARDVLFALFSGVMVLIFFGLGLMSKPMVVTFPFVLLLLDFWPLGRVTFGRAGKGLKLPKAAAQPRRKKGELSEFVESETGAPSWVLYIVMAAVAIGAWEGLGYFEKFSGVMIRGIDGFIAVTAVLLYLNARDRESLPGKLAHLLTEKIPLFLLSFLSCAETYQVQEDSGAMAFLQGIPFPGKLADAVESYVVYLGKAFEPLNLAVLYPFPKQRFDGMTWAAMVGGYAKFEGWAVGAAVVLAAATAALVWLSWRERRLQAAWLWFLGVTAAVIGLATAGATVVRSVNPDPLAAGIPGPPILEIVWPGIVVALGLFLVAGLAIFALTRRWPALSTGWVCFFGIAVPALAFMAVGAALGDTAPAQISDGMRAHAISPLEASWRGILAGAAMATMTALALWQARRRGYLPVGWLWYVGILVPVIGLIRVGAQSLADRYTYVPIIGIFIIVVWGVMGMAKRWGWPVLIVLAAMEACALLAGAGLWPWDASAALAAIILLAAVVAHGVVQRPVRLALALGAVAVGALIALAIVALEQGRLAGLPDTSLWPWTWDDKDWPWHFGLAAALVTLLGLGGVVVAWRSRWQVRVETGETLPMSTQVGLGVMGLAAVLGCMVLTSSQVMYFRNSEALFRHAVAVTERNAVAHNNLGVALPMAPNTDPEAIMHFRRALEIEPDYAEAHNNLAARMTTRDKLDEAIWHLHRAIEIRSRYTAAHYNLGLMLATLGRFSESIIYYKKALSIDPGYAPARNNLALAEQALRQEDESIEQLRKALQVNPNQWESHENLANILLRRGDNAGVEAECRAMAGLAGADAEKHTRIAMILLQIEKYSDAAGQLNEALRLKPDDAHAHTNLGIALAKMEKPEEAIREFRIVIAAEPGNPEAHGNLGRALLGLGRTEEAIVEYREALRLQPNLVKTLVNYARILGMHDNPKYRNGKEAIRLAEQACSLTNGQDPTAMMVLAGAYAEDGRFEDAVLVANRIIMVAERMGPHEKWIGDMMRTRRESYEKHQPVYESEAVRQAGTGTVR
jgi:tetratricopeptide (TPR) repeat protein